MSSTQAFARAGDTAFTPQEKSDIEAVAHSLERIWNEHQMDQLEPLLTEEADWVNPVGMWWRGRANIVRALSFFHSTFFRNRNLHQTALEIRRITADVAVAILRERADSFFTPDGMEIKESFNRLMLVLVKRSGKWLIASLQGTPIDDQAQQHDPIQTP